MTIEFRLVIDGKWREGSAKAREDVLNPATGDSIGKVAHASTADLDEALDAASRGLREWQDVAPWQRGTILQLRCCGRSSCAPCRLSVWRGWPG